MKKQIFVLKSKCTLPRRCKKILYFDSVSSLLSFNPSTKQYPCMQLPFKFQTQCQGGIEVLLPSVTNTEVVT